MLTKQIQHELGVFNAPKAQGGLTVASTGNLSIVSVDMGIRNLAYAHLVAHPASSGEARNSAEPSTYLRPNLLAWKRVVISGAPDGRVTSKKREKGDQNSADVATTPLQAAKGASGEAQPLGSEKEAFDPSTFANHAYNFIKSLLSAHQPTHVLIERQRFRSGGASAVQEWTIRVGVFEGMLHAVLRTLSEEHGLEVVVHGVDPGRVTRYWLEGGAAPAKERKRSGKESKKAKIDIVGEYLGRSDGALVGVGTGSNQVSRQEVGQVVEAFLARWKKQGRSRKEGGRKDVVKLDDLTDCLLQGVAWLNWQNKRQEVLQRGLEAFAEDPMFASVQSSTTNRGEGKQSTVEQQGNTRSVSKSKMAA